MGQDIDISTMRESLDLDIRGVTCKSLLACISPSTVERWCGLLPLSTVEERVRMQLLTCFDLGCQGCVCGGGRGLIKYHTISQDRGEGSKESLHSITSPPLLYWTGLGCLLPSKVGERWQMEILACLHLSPVIGQGLLDFEISSFMSIEDWFLTVNNW